MSALYYVYINSSGTADYGELIPAQCEIIGMAGTEQGAIQLAQEWNGRHSRK